MSQEDLFEVDNVDEAVMVLEDPDAMEISPDAMGISKSDQEEFGLEEKPRNEDDIAARSWIDAFFAGKQMYYGGDIPPAVLHSPAYIKTVLTFDIVHGITKVYELIRATGAIETTCDEDNIPADVSIVVDLLEECHILGVPKYYAAGIVLIALELCHGVVAPQLLAKSGF